MTAPLRLVGDPAEPGQAASKAYVDRMLTLLDSLTETEIRALIAVLTNPGGTIDARIAAAVAAYLPLAGGTMTGVLTLDADPALALEAATKQYVDLFPDSNYAGIGVNSNAVATVVEMISAYEMITIFAYDMPEKVSDGAFGSNNITPAENGDYNLHVNVTGSSGVLNQTYVLVLFALSATTYPLTLATNANPCVVTVNGHPFINGDRVKITGVAGMLEINDRVFTVAAAGANTFALNNDVGANVNSGGWGVYAGPGTAQLAAEIPVTHSHRKLAGIGDIGNFNNAGIATLVANEPLELFVMCTTGANDFTAVDANASIHRV